MQNPHLSSLKEVRVGAGEKLGRSRAQDILDVATAILLADGYAGLSFRKVAQEAGIGLGNLQHYFATKDDLIRAMLERFFDDFSRTMTRRAAAKRGDDAREELAGAVRYILKDQTKQQSCIIFWELWALASHDAAAAEIMGQFYERYVENIASLIQKTYPEASKARAMRAGTMIAALLEGASLFRGYGRPRHRIPAGLDQAIEAAIMKIAADA